MAGNLPAMQESWFQSQGWEDPLEESTATHSSILAWEDPLEESMATHSSFLAWRISMDRGAWGAIVQVVAKSWTQLSN